MILYDDLDRAFDNLDREITDMFEKNIEFGKNVIKIK